MVSETVGNINLYKFLLMGTPCIWLLQTSAAKAKQPWKSAFSIFSLEYSTQHKGEALSKTLTYISLGICG